MASDSASTPVSCELAANRTAWLMLRHSLMRYRPIRFQAFPLWRSCLGGGARSPLRPWSCLPFKPQTAPSVILLRPPCAVGENTLGPLRMESKSPALSLLHLPSDGMPSAGLRPLPSTLSPLHSTFIKPSLPHNRARRAVRTLSRESWDWLTLPRCTAFFFPSHSNLGCWAKKA